MHCRTFGKGDALDEAADTRANFDGIDCLEVAGELVPVGDGSLDRRRHRDLGSLHLWSVFTAC